MQPIELRSSPFSYLQTFSSISSLKNLERGCKIASSWITAQAMRLKSDASTTDIDVYLATNIHHRLYKAFETSDRLNFGELLLVPARNIAEKSVLRKGEDRNAYSQLKSALYQAKEMNNLESMIGYNQDCFRAEYLEMLASESPQKSVNTTGLCASACLYLIGKILSCPGFDVDHLIKLVHEIRKGLPAEVAAKQELYHEFDFDIVGIKLFDVSNSTLKTHFITDTTNILMGRAKRLKTAVPDTFRDELHQAIENILDRLLMGATQQKANQLEIFRELNNETNPTLQELLTNFDAKAILKAEKYRNNALAHLYGFKQDLEGTHLASILIGKEHLKNFNQLEDGIYQIAFKTLNESHSVVYIKQQDGSGYFFDPVKGLVQCKDFTHESVLLKLLSSYPPPSERLPYENDNHNYQINLTAYSH